VTQKRRTLVVRGDVGNLSLTNTLPGSDFPNIAVFYFLTPPLSKCSKFSSRRLTGIASAPTT